MSSSYREDVYKYIKKKYKAEPEYLWRRVPNYAVFRHDDNKKWFALIMDIPKSKLGNIDNTVVDVLNIKLSDNLATDLYIQREGFFHGYHISRSNWLSVLLDGTVDIQEIYSLIDESFIVTASSKIKHNIRPPKEWLIPSNPVYYDIVHAFDNTDEIVWKQGRGIKKGDTVFMYVGMPVSAVLYKCIVAQTDIPYNYTEGKLTIKYLMKIKLIKRYPPERFTFDVLKREFEIYAVRGPRGVPEGLSKALNDD